MYAIVEKGTMNYLRYDWYEIRGKVYTSDKRFAALFIEESDAMDHAETTEDVITIS
ncbi:hypothetical protein ACH6EH_06905 [Paenibacillus sp. JSM ZJ436]|uniref:hypothetical protein n=1 Tax=Paenibacillus sp. JSM ZJ436 TaxID=3376190 RepID=UPI0037B7772D